MVLSVIAIAVLVCAQYVTVKGKPLYVWMLREEGPVETLTAILLGLAALFALIAYSGVPDTLRWARPFLVLFSAFSALLALEEISWGQRIFNIESDAFFQQYGDQKETNLHNVVEQYLKDGGICGTRTRQIAAIVLLVYGVILPILNTFSPFRSWFRTCRVVVPPRWADAGISAWRIRPADRARGRIGELLFSLCFASLVPLWRLQQWSLAESAASGSLRAEAG